jgi:O-6-methylguanine DNA methyltransferase
LTSTPSESQKSPPPSVADDPRWARIVARDKWAGGHLWYSVSTTGVYCRPSCPSRTANPKNVQLHDSLASAKATGFRPCKRCNPDGPSIEAENAELVRNLQDRFPKAHLIGADRDYEALVVAQVVGFVEALRIGLDLPLDVRGTAFQERVWKALQEVPAGATVSYAEIARRIGAPKSVRAVAGACAANKLAVAIPCHRVVRNDGSSSGYAWRVERKRI